MSSLLSFRGLPPSFILTLCVAAMTSPAAAIDGSIGINQAQALAGGVTPGDAAGFPVTISTPGSYILTGNLVVADLNTSGIKVDATTGVSLDLNGFTIRGACPGVGGCALGAGSSLGIDATNSHAFSLSDGRIIGFASNGVSAATRARISELFVEGNGKHGIVVSTDSEIQSSRAFDNADVGVVASSSTVRRCASESNRDGMSIGGNSLVLENIVVSNTRNGILATGTGVMVQRNIVAQNAADGIVATASGALVVDNVAYGNVLGGIAMGANGSVQRNASFGNAIGLYLIPIAGNSPAYRDNTVGNSGVATVSGGVNLGGNLCNGTTSCP